MRENEINHNVIFCFFLTLWLVRTCVVYVVHEFLGEKRIKILNRERKRRNRELFIITNSFLWTIYILGFYFTLCWIVENLQICVLWEILLLYTHRRDFATLCCSVLLLLYVKMESGDEYNNTDTNNNNNNNNNRRLSMFTFCAA